MKYLALVVVVLGLVLWSASGPPVVNHESAFLPLTFEEALERAKQEDKVVFVDFWATWCPPCKEMNDKTFKNENFIKWFAENSIAIKVDFDQHPELARRYEVVSLPTLMFLEPTGEPFHKFVGYHSAKQLYTSAEAIMKKRASANSSP